MTKQHAATQPRKDLVARMFGSVARGICALACFPYEAMEHLHDWRSKTNVFCRGLSVVIGPTIGGIALFSYGSAVFGRTSIFYFLPFLAFLIDWSITGSAYDGHRQKSLNWMRGGLATISCLVAAYASLLSEQPALQHSLNLAQLQELEQGESARASQYRLVKTQIRQAAVAINENDSRLHRERPEIVARLNAAQMLYEKECHGASGIDASTGVRIVGGRCGRRAAGHKAEADAARRELTALEELLPQNALLQRQISELKRQQKEILSQHLTAVDSVGALFKALPHADFGVWFSVFSRLVVIMFCELLCLVWARIRPPQNVIDAVTDLYERDSRRLTLFHAASNIEINRNVPPVNFTVEDGDVAYYDRRDEAPSMTVPASDAHAGSACTSGSAAASSGSAAHSTVDA